MALLQKPVLPAKKPLSGERNGNATGIKCCTAANVADAHKKLSFNASLPLKLTELWQHLQNKRAASQLNRKCLTPQKSFSAAAMLDK
jgi:hypothetical protein